jgi:hypothetical protein
LCAGGSTSRARLKFAPSKTAATTITGNSPAAPSRPSSIHMAAPVGCAPHQQTSRSGHSSRRIGLLRVSFFRFQPKLSEPNRPDGVTAAPGRGCTHVRFCDARSRALAGSAGHCGRPEGPLSQFRLRSICRLAQLKNGPDGSSNHVRAASDLGSVDSEPISVCESVPLCAGTFPTIRLMSNRSVCAENPFRCDSGAKAVRCATVRCPQASETASEVR